MKKIVLALLVLAALTGGLFAQDAPAIKIEGTFDAQWIPYQYMGSEDKAGDSVSESGAALGRDTANGNGPRIRLLITGGNQFIGFNVMLQFYPYVRPGTPAGKKWVEVYDANDGTGTGQGQYVEVDTPASAVSALQFDDNAFIWYKPFGDNTLQVRAGKYRIDDIRGKVTDHWMRHYTVRSYDADAIFTRFSSGGVLPSNGLVDMGVLITSQIDDLYIGVNFPGLGAFYQDSNGNGRLRYGGNYLTDNGGGYGEFARTYERTQFAIGYTIQGVGLARAQYVGANNMITGTAGEWLGQHQIISPRIEAAFQVLSLMDMGLMFDIGFKVPLAVSASSVKKWDGEDMKWKSVTVGNDWKYQPAYGASLGVNYKMDAINVTARFDTLFAGSYKDGNDSSKDMTGPIELNVHLWPTYDLGFVVLGLDVGVGYYGEYKVDGKAAKDTGGMRFGAGFYVQKNLGNHADNYIRAGLAFSNNAEIEKKKEGVTTFSIPIMFSTRF